MGQATAISSWLSPTTLRAINGVWIDKLLTSHTARVVCLQLRRASQNLVAHPKVPRKTDNPAQHTQEKENNRTDAGPVKFELNLGRINCRPKRRSEYHIPNHVVMYCPSDHDAAQVEAQSQQKRIPRFHSRAIFKRPNAADQRPGANEP
jgi:hypothetical protein